MQHPDRLTWSFGPAAARLWSSRPAPVLGLPMAEPRARSAAARASGTSRRCCWRSATRWRRASAPARCAASSPASRARRSGHCYFTLKDAGRRRRIAALRDVPPRRQLLDFARPTASRSSCAAALGVYEPRGELQFVVESMQRPAPARCTRSSCGCARGSRPKACSTRRASAPLPPFPRRVGVVTSLGGGGAARRADRAGAARAARRR